MTVTIAVLPSGSSVGWAKATSSRPPSNSPGVPVGVPPTATAMAPTDCSAVAGSSPSTSTTSGPLSPGPKFSLIRS
jgi:hypothetical protein